ncbi:MAG: glycosyltransferase [Nitrospirae bacterium]|nr:glycosyltransferase [Nitrospirota bacterium]
MVSITLNRASPVTVFFLGTDEMQDRSGILQALSRRGPLTYFTRADGSYGQNHPGPASVRRRTNSERLLALFAELAVKEELPHLMIAQTWAGFVDPKVLREIRGRYRTFIVNIAMDDRHQYWGQRVDGEWWGTYGLIPYLDLALTAAPECVEWYQKEGCPALFFPEASDPDIFRPIPELPKLHDVCFVGGCYGVREKIVRALRKAGIQVTAYGSGWDQGRLDTEEVPRLFAQSKIVLGVGTIGHCEDFYALKMRDFDGPMSGSCYVTHDNPDLRLVYKVGEEIATYCSVDDCIDKVRWYLSHEDERERVAQAGRVRALADHTWEKRFDDLFDVLRKDLNSLGHGLRVQ